MGFEGIRAVVYGLNELEHGDHCLGMRRHPIFAELGHTSRVYKEVCEGQNGC